MPRPFDPSLIPDADAPAPYSVTEVNALARQILERNLHSVYVVGEMSNVSLQPSGHLYFTLKDAQSQIGAVMFRDCAEGLRFRPEAGLQVVAFGDVTLYSRWGQYQICVRTLEPRGIGALELAFRQLRDRLDAEGLFAEERKKPLPWLPRRIALVTSATGEAVHDMIKSIRDRFSGVRISVIAVQVQGPQAAPQIAAGIRAAGRMEGVDVIVTGRGGGSLEDIWAFNEEAVARAIAASSVPVVSAVGHERDVTISDLVADARAMTPTQVGQLIVPDETELRERIGAARDRLADALRRRAERARADLDFAWRHPVFARPTAMLAPLASRLERVGGRFKVSMERASSHAAERLRTVAVALESLSPLAVLSRGYSVTRDSGWRVLTDTDALEKGQTIETILRRGRLLSVIKQITPGQEGLERGEK
jgi:exodeoxyribonuclease VII large subunit